MLLYISYDMEGNRMRFFKKIIIGSVLFISSLSLSFAFSDKAAASDSHGAVRMHRLYNPNSGEHFYTGDVSEKNGLITEGWNYEGVAWYAPGYSLFPVYRLYNPNAGDHHYTMDVNERDHLTDVGWTYEGIGWYSSESQTVALFRLYNPNAMGAGAHHYTVDEAEKDLLVDVGWSPEGISWYGMDETVAEPLIEQAEKGSLGFFEEMGASEAVNVLKNASYRAYTEIGAKNDATSLDNMKAALDMIDDCNLIRANLGIEPLTVTDYMMAVAQSNANASAYILSSTKQYNVAENVAWASSDPFRVWYVNEKKLYDAGTTDFQYTGHYQNIVNNSFTVTGYAVNNYGVYKKTDLQVFQYRTKGYSADEYRARFMKYYNQYR